MSEIIAIEGGHKLNGTVEISGAKNATVALIPAIILADSPVTIYGVPEISDVDALAVLLEELNCTVLRSHDSLIVDPSRMENVPLVSDAVDKLRASYYLKRNEPSLVSFITYHKGLCLLRILNTNHY